MACLHRSVRKRFDCYRTKDERCSKNDQGRILQRSVRYDRSSASRISRCSRRSSHPPRRFRCHCRLSFYQSWQAAGATRRNFYPQAQAIILASDDSSRNIKDVRSQSQLGTSHGAMLFRPSTIPAWYPTPLTLAMTPRPLPSQVDAAVSKACSVS